MAEIAGLALGVAALYSACVDVFDVAISATDCSREYEELSALLGLQRLRFELWGESVGLPSGRFNYERAIPYNAYLDLPQVRPDIERALENIRQLLDSVGAIDERYGVTTSTSLGESLTSLRGFQIFGKYHDRVKKHIKKLQKEKSTGAVTVWALRDAAKFKDTITTLTSFVDGLCQVTTTLCMVQPHFEALRISESINTIVDEEDLELLVDAASKHSGTSINRTVSDAASRRLTVVTASIKDSDKFTQPRSNASTGSFYTAKTKPSEHLLETVHEMDLDEAEHDDMAAGNESFNHPLFVRSCAECDDERMPCVTLDGSISCSRCIDTHKQCSFDLNGAMLAPEVDSLNVASSITPRDIPQHQRLLADIATRSTSTPRALSFQGGDAEHGNAMSDIKNSDFHDWINNIANLNTQARGSTSAMKRMFHELQIIERAHVPFVSAATVGNNLGRILASIEGPPETPYEGGIFWILVSASRKIPPGAPTLQFHTKIYHPNIDHRTGKLCADYQQKWSASKLRGAWKGKVSGAATSWSERTSPEMWSLLGLLVAICGLLASPNVEDPLVPEIAQTYIEDPDRYNDAAKKWTKKYAASKDKPPESSLNFDNIDDDTAHSINPELRNQIEREDRIKNTLTAIQDFWRFKYDDKIVENGVDIATSSSFSREDIMLDVLSSDEQFTKDRSVQIIDSFVRRNEQELRRRQQMVGDCFADIEQWRMVREVRLELEKGLYQKESSVSFGLSTNPRSMTEMDLRLLIAARASVRKGPHNTNAKSDPELYIEAMRKSFITSGGRVMSRNHGPRFTTVSNDNSSNVRIPGPSRVAKRRRTWSSRVGESKRMQVWETRLLLDSTDDTLGSPRYTYTPTPNTSGNVSLRKQSSSQSFHSTASISNSDYRTHTRPTTFEPRTPRRATSISRETHRPRADTTSSMPRTPNDPEYEYEMHGGTVHVRSAQASASSDYRSYSPTFSSYDDVHDVRGRYDSVSQSPSQGRYYSTPPSSSPPRYVYHPLPNRVHSPARWPQSRLQPSAQSQRTPTHRRHSPPPTRPTTAKSKKPAKAVPVPKATEADARKHKIPPGYSLKNWDPSEEPIMLLGSVFDANSIGKWIYDWTVYHHGPATPIADMAGELWLLLIQLGGKLKRAEETMPRIRLKDNMELVDDFIESGERLTDKFKKLLKSIEVPMLKAGKKHGEKTQQLGKNAGTEFVEVMFGRDRQLETTEKLMSSVRLWNLRFDANCEDILRRPGQGFSDLPRVAEAIKDPVVEDAIVLLPVTIRTHFGLEDVPE